jgi:hypothetical protein
MTQQSWNESEVDALLRGRHPRDPELVELAPWVSALRVELNRPVTEAEIKAASSRLAVAAREAASIVPQARTVWVRRVTIATIAAGLLGCGVAGAAAADDAAPGDQLYGLDRALEVVGIHNGGFPERLLEVKELIDRGEDEAALDLLADSLEEEGDAEGKQALLDAAARLRENGSEQSADVHAAVAAMLTWMATTDATGKEFGQGVSELAREIGAKPDDSGKPEDTGKPDASTPSPSPATPDKPDTPAEPTEPGSKPDDTPSGKPSGTGDDTGRPSDAGTKPDKGKP